MSSLDETCPRCWGRVSYFTVSRIRTSSNTERRYLYAVHERTIVVGGREKVVRRKCYLGPVGGYRYAEKLHKLNLTNLSDADYMASAVRSLEREREIWDIVYWYYTRPARIPGDEAVVPDEVISRIDERLGELDQFEKDILNAINTLRERLKEIRQKLEEEKNKRVNTG